MTKISDIGWVAGILEGEGCFEYVSTTPTIRLGMSDEDVVNKIRNLMAPQATVGISFDKRGNRKPMYRFRVCGKKAASWMMTIYPLMGQRRKEEIKKVLLVWSKPEEKKRIDAIKIIAQIRKISIEAATELYKGLVN